MATRPNPIVVRRLFALSMNQCSFTGCSEPIIESTTNTIVGEVCHIRAQRTGGPRHDPALTSERVHAFENLLLLCRPHHRIIDARENLATYTVERLVEMKTAHEANARTSSDRSMTLNRELLRALIESATEPRSGDSVNMDFRGAEFRVGGEGGGLGGGGGGGGVLKIIGTTSVPAEAELALNGQAGRAPGAGGGGAGALRFEGRPSGEVDRDEGLRASAFCPVNSFEVSGLVSMLGGAWTYFPIATIPGTATIRVVGVLELGVLEKGTLLRVELQAVDPRGDVAASDAFDVAVPESSDLTPKGLIGRAITIPVSEPGVWTLRLCSGNLLLAEYELEFRVQSSS